MSAEKVLENKIALVTGASRGIGKSIALRLAEAGAHVILNCNQNTEKANEVAAEIKAKQGLATVKAFSVRDNNAVDTAIKEILANIGNIDILVNNAGITCDNLIMRMSEEDWDSVLDTNLKGAFLCIRALTRPMMKARSGSIINITSVVGQVGNIGQAAYCASKAGMIGLTKATAKELASRGIRVNAVAPGFITTEMTDAIPENAKNEMLRNIPLEKFGQPHDIAEAVLWLASPASAYVTGQVLNVNGGMYM